MMTFCICWDILGRSCSYVDREQSATDHKTSILNSKFIFISYRVEEISENTALHKCFQICLKIGKINAQHMRKKYLTTLFQWKGFQFTVYYIWWYL